MKTPYITGAALVLVALGAAAVAQNYTPVPPTVKATEAPDDMRAMTIWRDPNCGCCDAYAEYMEDNGYTVTRIDDRDFDKRALAAGVPEQGLGCHLSEIGGYYVSGLVPADIVARVLTDKPAIAGITLPGMPANAPGMGGKSGTLKTYAFGADGVSVYADE